MAAESYGSKTDVVVKLILVFFISLLSFSIGTFVGKKFSDNQHRISLVEPTHGDDSEESPREVASVPPDSNEVKPKDALTDEEIKKLAEEFVADDTHKPTAENPNKHEEEHKTDKNSEHHEVAAHDGHKPTQKSEVAERVIAGKTPEVEKHETSVKNRIPQSLPKDIAASSAGKYTVQIGSYPEEAEAQKQASSLKDKGFSAFYFSANINGKTYYRVSVGLFTTQKEADAYKKDLISRAKVTSAFVQKIN